MKKIDLILSPEQASSKNEIERIALKKAQFKQGNVLVTKRSIDARRSPVKIRLQEVHQSFYNADCHIPS